MKAARIYGPRDLRLVDMTTPEPGPGEVLCKVRCCGICGTDYAIYTGDYSFIQEGLVKFPMTPGINLRTASMMTQAAGSPPVRTKSPIEISSTGYNCRIRSSTPL